ncbi:MAG: ABC transporter family substrate-binding protein [Acidimicrobiales bacterium]
MKKLAYTAAALAAAGLILAACSSSNNNASGSGGSGALSPQSVKSGGSITFALDEDIPGWNINTSADAEFVLQEVMNLIWPQAYLVAPNLSLILNTDLLQSVTETSTSPQTLVYKIQPNAKWQDGQPIDAEDFYYNWAAQNGSSSNTDINGKPFDDASTTGYNQVKSVTGSAPANGAACQSTSITGIGSIPCANGKTVTVVFSSPFADWKSLFGNIVPAHKAATVGWNTGFNNYQNVLSGGWYTMSNYVENQYIVLKKNPNYYGTPGKLNQITFQIFNGDTQAVPAMQNGEVQVINPLQVDLSVVQAADQLTGVTKSTIGGLEFQHIDFNESDYYLAQKPVRQAIAYAIDRKQIVQRTVGEFDPSITPLDNRMFVPSQSSYVNNGSAYDTQNLTLAKSLLQGAGMTMGSDGYFQPTSGPQKGQDLTFTIKSTSGNSLRANIEQLIQADLKSAGIKLNIANEDAATLFGTDLPQGNFQITLFAWVATPFVSGNQSIYCSYTNTNNCGENWDHYANPQVDQLLAKGASASSAATENSDYNQADKLLWSDMVTLPLFQDPVFAVWSNKYGNILNNPASVGLTWNAQEWGVKAS